MEQLIGQRIGGSATNNRYKLESLLGKQSGRRTFLAQDCQTRQQVVVKLVLFSPDFDWQDLKLFEREAETLQSLDHPAIPKYLDSFEVEMDWGRGFALVQTYIEARSLQDWVSAGRTFSEHDLSAIAQSLLKILHYLHHRNPPVIHRDIKPSNILLTGETLYLVDFGSVQIAHTSGTMTIVGTYGYMPPEQFGGRAQPASDLYSLGATLIYLATGRHPADLTAANLQIAFEPYSTLSPAFTHWIKRLTYTDLARRTPSTTAALSQLTRPQPVRPQPVLSQFARPQPAIKAPSVPQHSISITRTPSPPPLKQTLSDFKILTTPQSLEIRCLQFRLSENFILAKPINFSENAISSKDLKLTVIALSLAILIVTVAATDFLIVAILLLAMAFAILYPTIVATNLGSKREARIKLSRSSEGKAIISLSTVPSAAIRSPILQDYTMHLLEVPVRSLFLDTDSVSGTCMSLYLTRDNGSRSDRLQISGSNHELQWLYTYISQWNSDLMSRQES